MAARKVATKKPGRRVTSADVLRVTRVVRKLRLDVYGLDYGRGQTWNGIYARLEAAQHELAKALGDLVLLEAVEKGKGEA